MALRGGVRSQWIVEKSPSARNKKANQRTNNKQEIYVPKNPSKTAVNLGVYEAIAPSYDEISTIYPEAMQGDRARTAPYVQAYFSRVVLTMLRAVSGQSPFVVLASDRASLANADHAVWIDLIEPSEHERAEIEHLTGLCVPDRSAVAEIETSSRLVNANGVLTLSTPMITRDADGGLVVAPLGFVVSPDRLLTIRFANSVVFDTFAEHWRAAAPAGTISGMEPFLGILEAMVDRLADVLEQLGAELDALSAKVFLRGSETKGPSRKRDQFLQRTLTEIGQRGEHVSHLRDGLLGVGRIVRFVQETALDWLQEGELRRLKTIDRDIVSLNDYDTQMTGKIQFLLDATLGFINIEQNNTIKVLTVVSIVGIPPTFVASLYGMNFKNMPELGWTYGYQYGLSMIALSILVPLLVFWRKGWL